MKLTKLNEIYVRNKIRLHLLLKPKISLQCNTQLKPQIVEFSDIFLHEF